MTSTHSMPPCHPLIQPPMPCLSTLRPITTTSSVKRNYAHVSDSTDESDCDARTYKQGKHQHPDAEPTSRPPMPEEAVDEILNHVDVNLDRFQARLPASLLPVCKTKLPSQAAISRLRRTTNLLDNFVSRQKEALKRLRSERHKESTSRSQRELGVRQDMMLQMLKHKAEADRHKALLTTQTTQHANLRLRYTRLEADYRTLEEKHTKLEKEYQDFKEHHKRHMDSMARDAQKHLETANKRVAEMKAQLWAENEHMAYVCKLHDEDLEELRRLENEEKARRDEFLRHTQLPPSYGSLDDEINTPTYEMHSMDGGPLELSKTKQVVRLNFLIGFGHSQEAMRIRTDSPDPRISRTAGTIAFRDYSTQLRLAAESIQEILKHAPDVTCKIMTRGSGPSWFWHHGQRARLVDPTDEAIIRRTHRRAKEVIDLTGDEPSSPLKPQKAKAKESEIGKRCAELLIDLIWRVAARLENYPLTIHLDSKDLTVPALAWTSVDDILLQALKMTFKGPSPPFPYSRFDEMSRYEMEIKSIAARLSMNHTGIHDMLGRSVHWLDEQVEKERQLDAAREMPETPPAEATCDGPRAPANQIAEASQASRMPAEPPLEERMPAGPLPAEASQLEAHVERWRAERPQADRRWAERLHAHSMLVEASRAESRGTRSLATQAFTFSA